MYTEKTTTEKLVYNGQIIKVYELKVDLHNGSSSRREVVRHNGGACTVAIDDEKNVYLVQQYRKPIEQQTLEIPAGKLEPGEDPYVCAVRELREETGITAQHIESLGFIYPSPGFCDEKLYLYLATGLSFGKEDLDTDEYLSCIRISLDECLARIETGEINDSKTIIGLLRVARRLENPAV